MLIDGYDTLLLDLDGVVYLGSHAVPGAPEALEEARRHGVRLAYVTNNASRTPAAIAAHLRELGAPATAEDVVTSAQAAARLIAERVPPGSKVLVVGGSGLRMAVRRQGLRPVSTAAESPVAVVQGIAPGLSYGLLSEGALAVRQGALFVASNADSTMPTGRGELPGNGAMVRVIAHATGVEPIYAGKPDPPLHRESMIRTGARRPLVVGDRLDTDIEGASNARVESLLVLTGVATAADVLTAEPRHRPTYVGEDLGALLQPYPEVRDGACGGWRAEWRDGVLRLDGEGSRIDGLRAACAAAWAAAGEGRVEEDAVKPVLERVG
ncbi:4-nitrophenylphosphatase [[Actinomadura] parvosata subsp. kistnae]|uniref:HAD family hydrolase n=1 Tax=[Actinomadura] parvosata subsp. kistnae TaxID=1909395 RepID=A0A1U9ZSP8_9ACTN|nr:HAD-IIA family hydrolase [Nonomuraea sp. ATCC 55076]AQZ60974.1 HAD family hydrolase [Nonomuraea sp. ATCC 55076]SPL91481.1 4-nitrophenylphosphatase [Actinomadura parvosata subsp. kistnae]